MTDLYLYFDPNKCGKESRKKFWLNSIFKYDTYQLFRVLYHFGRPNSPPPNWKEGAAQSGNYFSQNQEVREGACAYNDDVELGTFHLNFLCRNILK